VAGDRDDRDRDDVTAPRWLVAPAKLTLSLQVLGRRPDGYHELEAEMVTVDLADRLLVDPAGDGMVVEARRGTRADGLVRGDDNLVRRALAAVRRTASVRLDKRIPVGGGLGGGSADAAAVLRWAGCADPQVAARLGADVPFCVAGGRALVRGIGEQLSPLPYELRHFVLLVPPFSVSTAAAYREWDRLASAGAGTDPAGRNDLTGAALAAEPRLGRWRDALGDATGREPVLAGSGSTWWVEGTPAELGIEGAASLGPGRDEGRLIPVCTVPADWAGPGTGEGAPGGRWG
jgi:4-diphosphocytidyl-2-C-methyl-D-erythritol kinase